MQNSKAWLYPLVAALVLGAVACGGGSSEPPAEASAQDRVKPPAEAPARDHVEPPSDPIVDIEPGSISVGNQLNPSLVENDRLPPQLFGTIPDGKDLTWKAAGDTVPTRVRSVTIYAQTRDGSRDPNNYLTLQQTDSDTLQWTRTGPDGTVALVAYDPSEHGSDCFLMSQNLQPFIVSGDDVSYTTINEQTGTGTLKAANGVNPRIQVTLRLADGNPCAPED